MRDIPVKVDNSDNLLAEELNIIATEIENLVTRSGQTLNPAGGPDTDTFQVSRAVLLHALAGQSYQDGGAANSFVLTALQPYQQPTAYFNGMTVRFKAAATNTGGCTINVGGLGAVAFTQAGGAAFTAGILGAGNNIVAQYFQSTNRFELVSNTTPELSGPAAPDQVAVYSDAGSATGVVLTIEPGFIQPSAFTDQMVILFKSNAQNNGTGNHTIQITGLGTRDVVEKDGTNPRRGRFEVGDWVMCAFREVRNAFEIVFVYELPRQDVIAPALAGASSGTLYNLNPLSGTRPITSYEDGFTVVFKAPVTNSGSLDINFAGIGQRDLRKQNGTNFVSGEVPVNTLIVAQFIASENRFRALSGAATTSRIIHSEGFGARSSGVQNGSVGPNQTVVLNWNSPDFDDLNWYDAGNDRFRVPSGQNIDRIDVCCNIRIATNAPDSYSLEISVGGNPVASGSVNARANAEGISITLLDIPVSDGSVIEAELNINAAAARTFNYANMAVRVSKFN